MGENTLENLFGQTLNAVIPYIALAALLYLGVKWITNNNPLKGMFPSTGSTGLFQNKRSIDTEKIVEKHTQGKKLESEAQNQKKEMEKEEQGTDIKSFQEWKTEEKTTKKLPHEPETEKQETIQTRLKEVNRAKKVQERKAASKIVDLADKGKVEGLSSEQVKRFKEEKQLHRKSVQEEEEISQERKGLEKVSQQEKRIEENVLEDLPHEPRTEKQKRIKKRLEAIRRAKQETERTKDKDVLGFDIPFV